MSRKKHSNKPVGLERLKRLWNGVTALDAEYTDIPKKLSSNTGLLSKGRQMSAFCIILYHLLPSSLWSTVCLPYRNQLYFSVHQQCKNGWSHKLNGYLILFTLFWRGWWNELKTSEVREQLESSEQRCVLGTSSERYEVSLQTGVADPKIKGKIATWREQTSGSSVIPVLFINWTLLPVVEKISAH